MTPSAPEFWNYVRENLERRGKDCGVAILNYSKYL